MSSEGDAGGAHGIICLTGTSTAAQAVLQTGDRETRRKIAGCRIHKITKVHFQVLAKNLLLSPRSAASSGLLQLP